MGPKKASCIPNESHGKLPEVEQEASCIVKASCIRNKSHGKWPEVEQELSDLIGIDNNGGKKASCIVKASCIRNESHGKLPEVEHELSDLIGVDNNRGVNLSEDEPRLPESMRVISIKEKLEQACQDDKACSRAKLSIYRIPHHLKDGEHKAYIPQMDWHKWRILYCILSRTGHEISLYLDTVKKLKKKARTCYEGTITMSNDEFVEMMVLDGCFVIELFLGFISGFKKLHHPHNDSVLLLFEIWDKLMGE